MKVYQIVGSGSWLPQVGAVCPCGDSAHKRLTASWRDAQGRVRVQGVASLLKESQAYPLAMGVHVVGSWLKGDSSRPEVQSPEGHQHVRATGRRQKLKVLVASQGPQMPMPSSSLSWLQPASGHPIQPTTMVKRGSSSEKRLWASPTPSSSSTDKSQHKKVNCNGASWQQPLAGSQL